MSIQHFQCKTSYSPGAAWVIFAPPQIPSLSLENDGGWDFRSISADAFNYGDKIPIPAVDILDNLLITVNNGVNPPPNPELDTLFVHVVDVFELNVVPIDGVAKKLEIIVNNSWVECSSTDTLQGSLSILFSGLDCAP